jgi:hypothetical protein
MASKAACSDPASGAVDGAVSSASAAGAVPDVSVRKPAVPAERAKSPVAPDFSRLLRLAMEVSDPSGCDGLRACGVTGRTCGVRPVSCGRVS